MKILGYLVLLLTLISCNGKHEQAHQSNAGHSDNTEPAHHSASGHAHGSANEYMHQTPVEELIERFESAERDAYQQPQKVMDYLGDISGKKVIDIGAGSGYFSVRMAEKGAYVIAADVDEAFQAFIEERIATNKLSGIETRKIPYDSPGLDDQEVDMALIVNTYHHIENRSAYFTKVRSGLKQNGELVVIDFFDFETPVGPKHHRISIDTVIDELKKAGFTNFSVDVNLLPYQYIIKAI